MKKKRPDWLKPFNEYTADDLTGDYLGRCLAGINRFGNRSPVPWSVARHSVLVARLMPAETPVHVKLYALCHDVHEIFSGDIQRPAFERVRLAMSDYQREIDDHVLPLMGLNPTEEEREYVHKFDIEAGEMEVEYLGRPVPFWPRIYPFNLRLNDATMWSESLVFLRNCQNATANSDGAKV
jgi:hypothetical protein